MASRVLLSHGDLLCTRDEGYQKFRRITQQNGCAGLPAPAAGTPTAIAHKMRAARARWKNAHKSQTIMDVTPEAVDEMLRRHGCRLMIHGHTHRPAIHDFPWTVDRRDASCWETGSSRARCWCALPCGAAARRPAPRAEAPACHGHERVS